MLFDRHVQAERKIPNFDSSTEKLYCQIFFNDIVNYLMFSSVDLYCSWRGEGELRHFDYILSTNISTFFSSSKSSLLLKLILERKEGVAGVRNN